MNFVNKLKSIFLMSILRQSLLLLSANERRKTYIALWLQIFLNLLDLIGVALIGFLGVLAVGGIQSQPPDSSVYLILDFLNIEKASFQNQVAYLAIVATLVLVSRTIVSMFILRKTIFFLSSCAAKLTEDLMGRVLSQPLTEIETRSTQETLYILTIGVPAILLGIITSAIALVSDLALLSLMIFAMIIVDPSLGLTSIVLFGGVGILLNRIVNTRARSFGSKMANLTIDSNSKILEALSSFRESVVRNRREFYVREIGKTRVQLSNLQAEIAFMPNIGKYVIELTLILGALSISAIQFFLNDAPNAVATLSVFIAAGSRITPAMLRIQQNLIQFKGNVGNAEPAINLINKIYPVDLPVSSEKDLDFSHVDFIPQIKIENVDFTYKGSSHAALKDINLVVSPGQSIAIVGGSGAGKSTLTDILLGVFAPTSGQVRIGGYEPLTVFSKWPGAVAYVPQEIFLSNSSIRENIGMGFPPSVIHEELIWESLRIASLSEFVEQLPHGLDTNIGENGASLSGGQRQRLGIARAFLTKPKLIVLDEATSALDGGLEATISEAIKQYAENATLIVIAHRLSTVRHVDHVVFMRNGRIESIGTFDQVRAAVKDFDDQARLMGL